MPAYDFQCPGEHVTTVQASMSESLGETRPCPADGCREDARRVFHAPAAIVFKGRGFYSTDVKGSQQRRRRPNAGDSLPRHHQPDSAAIARSL